MKTPMHAFTQQLKRSHTCGQLSLRHEGKTVILNGWVHRLRDHGGVYFINLRDRYGLVQVVVDEASGEAIEKIAATLRHEDCLAIQGCVRLRPENMRNADMATGEVEVHAREITVLSRSEVLPFVIESERSTANEDLRLKHRYLDIRRGSMTKALTLRHVTTHTIRQHLHKRGFLEIETPTLIRSTPEGARDFLVPSRTAPGSFYALAQSPQLYKQMLMIGGMDKYYQCAHCYRDEDARGDRQPEHTQVDIEMSFVTADDIMKMTEELICDVFRSVLNIPLPRPFVRMRYDDAMERYGSDKPDTRYDLHLADASFVFEGSGFPLFEDTIKNGGRVTMLKVPAAIASTFSRKHIDELELVAKQHGASALMWTRCTVSEIDEKTRIFTGGVAKFLSTAEHDNAEKYKRFLENNGDALVCGDLLLFVGSQSKIALSSLGSVRKAVAERARLTENVPHDKAFAFTWIVDFPLFEWDAESNAWSPAHHMFTMPQAQYVDTLENDPAAVRGELYDLVCNGMEIASGSIRIHDAALQHRIFSIIGMSTERAESQFGFLLKALKYGAPPHGGIAPGLDRLIMLMRGEKTIRDVMAFPKNTNGASPMDGSPAPVDESKLKELFLSIEKKDSRA